MFCANIAILFFRITGGFEKKKKIQKMKIAVRPISQATDLICV